MPAQTRYHQATMNILLLGAGMQGKAVLHDLIEYSHLDNITAADANLDMLKAHVKQRGWEDKVSCIHVDGSSPDSLDRAMQRDVDIVIDLQPKWFAVNAARAALKRGVNFINASYPGPEFKQLDAQIRAKGLTFLPEFGLDPGLDLVMLGDGARSLDVIEEIHSYGSGIPEWSAANNPIHYKVSWSFEGALDAYRRNSRMIRDGKLVEIDGMTIFSPEHVTIEEIEGVGKLESYPNGDAAEYAGILGVDPKSLKAAGRYTLRWPGHAAFWKALVDLHLLDREPVMVEGAPVNRIKFLSQVMGPHLQYAPGERDIAIVRVDLIGQKDGQRKRLRYEIVDYLDLATGLSAMSRTVGFTIGIGALWLADGTLKGPGIISPLNDVPFAPLARELNKRGVRITREETTLS